MNIGWTIEIDITHQCNMACRHCNRLCNAEAFFGLERQEKEMNIKHIDYLCDEIKKQPIGKIKMVRIIGGEPLISKLISYTVLRLEDLQNLGYIEKITIITNGTIAVPEICKPYIEYSPICIGDMIKEKNRILTTNEVYAIKNIKHRNITVSPLDYNLPFQRCGRISDCGIQYSIYGFSYTAACFPAMVITSKNHKRFLYHLPRESGDFFDQDFDKEVCSLCVYAIIHYKTLIAECKEINTSSLIGRTWFELIANNKHKVIKPNTNWINKIKIQR